MFMLAVLCSLLPALLKADTQCLQQSGTCRYTSEGCSEGLFWTGKCDGSVDRQCCIPGSESRDRKCVQDSKGFCQIKTNPCSGSHLPGKCAGRASRQCCVPSSGGQLKVGQICHSNPTNRLRGCDPSPYGCGHYGASRSGRIHKGSDVICTMGDDVYAPFPGTLIRRVRPYGNGKCCDTGLLLQGSGIWSDYKVKMFYVSMVGNPRDTYSEGDLIATHVGLHCGCYDSRMTDHVHFQLYHKNKIIDPTKMLTG